MIALLTQPEDGFRQADHFEHLENIPPVLVRLLARKGGKVMLDLVDDLGNMVRGIRDFCEQKRRAGTDHQTTGRDSSLESNGRAAPF